MEEKSRAHLIVKGRVQGVFFRAHAQETATRLGLTGWVRNMDDGGVEIVAEGKKPVIEKLVEWCQAGPPSARVLSVHVEWEEQTGEFDYFEITY